MGPASVANNWAAKARNLWNSSRRKSDCHGTASWPKQGPSQPASQRGMHRGRVRHSGAEDVSLVSAWVVMEGEAGNENFYPQIITHVENWACVGAPAKGCEDTKA